MRAFERWAVGRMPIHVVALLGVVGYSLGVLLISCPAGVGSAPIPGFIFPLGMGCVEALWG